MGIFNINPLYKLIGLCFMSAYTPFLTADQQDEFYWKHRVYLASYPRTGSHWIRYLLEEATGLVTSSVYQDMDFPEHMSIVFPWGGYCPDHGYEGMAKYPSENDVVVVKTHFPIGDRTKFNHLPYSRIIRIVRHPIDTIYAHHMRFWKSDIPEDQAKIELTEAIRAWRMFHEYWDSMPNVFTVRYEDLLINQKFFLKKILLEADFSFLKEDIERAVRRYPPIGIPLKHLSHFNEEDLKTIELELEDLMEKYGYSISLILDWKQDQD